jgi:hypothetical protein
VVAGFSPVIPCENETAEFPAPSDDPPAAGARVPNESLQLPGLAVAYRNQPVVAEPPGFADPFNWAVLPVSSVALLVVTDGGFASVVNESTAPNVVPYEFRPSAQ